jgi:hypothetical protein
MSLFPNIYENSGSHTIVKLILFKAGTSTTFEMVPATLARVSKATHRII